MEFDEQIGHLTKLMVDSLNETLLSERARPFEAGAKGISKFARFLENSKFPDETGLVQLLRDLQNLRSTGAAHRKGSAYEKVARKLGIDSLGKQERSGTTPLDKAHGWSSGRHESIFAETRGPRARKWVRKGVRNRSDLIPESFSVLRTF